MLGGLWRAAFAAAAVTVAGCALPSRGPATTAVDTGLQFGQVQPGRTLVIAVSREVTNMSFKMKHERGAFDVKRPFNATLALLDDRDTPHPYLAEALPELRTDSWRVSPDGKMETTYRLRPSLTWQDGAPLTAEDFVFAWRVYMSPGVEVTEALPQRLMGRVEARDDRTLVIGWDSLYPEANALSFTFPPLPRHLLEGPFSQDSPEAFLARPYWTREYVGLGPYRLDRWEPGAFLEGTAFAAHALGRPKVERVRLIIAPDPNTALANLLSEAAHIAVDATLSIPQGLILQREWGPRGGGTVLVSPSFPRFFKPQSRPDLVQPRALLDGRVRKALAYAMDRPTLAEALHGELGVPAETVVRPSEPWYPAVDRAITRYRYDPRQAEQLISDAGFRKGADGFFASPGEGRFALEVRTNVRGENEQEMAILADTWRRAGFDIAENAYPTARRSDGEWLASFPGLLWGGPAELRKFITSVIPHSRNGWVGQNQGSWSNAEYDRLFEAFLNTLDMAERIQQVVQMTRIISEELPAFTTFYDLGVDAHLGALRGPRAGGGTFNLHDWEWTAVKGTELREQREGVRHGE